jgi:hypothetical protein
VLGVDGSVRSPYNITRNFLGDRAITVDFSYRVRQLYYAEPFFNETYLIRNPLQASASGRTVFRNAILHAHHVHCTVFGIFPISSDLAARFFASAFPICWR